MRDALSRGVATVEPLDLSSMANTLGREDYQLAKQKRDKEIEQEKATYNQLVKDLDVKLDGWMQYDSKEILDSYNKYQNEWISTYNKYSRSKGGVPIEERMKLSLMRRDLESLMGASKEQEKVVGDYYSTLRSDKGKTLDLAQSAKNLLDTANAGGIMKRLEHLNQNPVLLVMKPEEVDVNTWMDKNAGKYKPTPFTSSGKVDAMGNTIYMYGKQMSQEDYQAAHDEVITFYEANKNKRYLGSDKTVGETFGDGENMWKQFKGRMDKGDLSPQIRGEGGGGPTFNFGYGKSSKDKQFESRVSVPVYKDGKQTFWEGSGYPLNQEPISIAYNYAEPQNETAASILKEKYVMSGMKEFKPSYIVFPKNSKDPIMVTGIMSVTKGESGENVLKDHSFNIPYYLIKAKLEEKNSGLKNLVIDWQKQQGISESNKSNDDFSQYKRIKK